MASDRRQPRHLRTRVRLFEVATELYLERGFEGCHLREVARRAQVNVSGVAYHFGSKLGLMEAIAWDALEEISGPSPLADPVLSRFVTLVGEILAPCSNHALWHATLRYRLLSDPDPEVDRIVSEIAPGYRHLLSQVTNSTPERSSALECFLWLGMGAAFSEGRASAEVLRWARMVAVAILSQDLEPAWKG